MQNRSTIGYLSKQYNSVLKRCFFIGLGACSAVASTDANAAVDYEPLSGNPSARGFLDAMTFSEQAETFSQVRADVSSGYVIEPLVASKDYFTTFSIENAGPTLEYGILLKGSDYDQATNSGLYGSLGEFIKSYVVGSTAHGYEIVYNSDALVTDPGYFNIKYKNEDGTYKNLNFKIVDGSGNLVITPNARIVHISGDYGNVDIDFSGLSLSAASTATALDIPDSSGAAIYNTANMGNITGDFIGNYIHTMKAMGGGVAIYNDGVIADITGDFVGNFIYNVVSSVTIASTQSLGGSAIFNEGAINNITGDFIGNYIRNVTGSLKGGAIYNKGTINKIEGDFIENYVFDSAQGQGSAIYNDTGGMITSVVGNFIGNYIGEITSSLGGGAIFNKGTIDSITGDFIGNSTSVNTLSSGGALRNEIGTINSITGDFIENYVYVSGGLAYGGAIRNINKSKIGEITGDFINNYAKSDTRDASGGAFRTTDSPIGNIVGNFIGNYAHAISSYVHGGAIYNSGASINDIKGDFINNFAFAKTYSWGGALYNASGTIGLTDASFFNNYAVSTNGTAIGGAIYNVATINMNANSKNVIFRDNYTKSGSNAEVYNAIYSTGTINFNAQNGYGFIFNDSLTGTGNYNLKTGSLTLLGANAGFASTSKFNTSAGTRIIVQDNSIGTNSLGTLNILGNTSLSIDIDLDTKEGDKLTGTATGAGSLILDNINVMGGGTDVTTYINLKASSGNIYTKIALSTTETITEGYDATTYNNSSGILTILKNVNLKDMVNSLDEVKNYTMNFVEDVTETLGKLNGTSLAVIGKGNDIVANGVSIGGITMDAGQTLSFADVGEIKDFDGSFIDATGGNIVFESSDANITNLKNSIEGSASIVLNKESTSTGEIIFDATLEANDISISNGSVAFNYAVTSSVANDGTSTVFNSNLTGDITSNNGSIVFNNSSVVGDATNHGTIAYNNSSITGDVGGTGTITTTGNTTFLNGAIGNNLTVTSGTTTFDGSTINAEVNATGGITTDGNTTFADDVTVGSLTNIGTLSVNSALGVTGVITNTGGTFNLNTDMTLSNTFSGGTLNLGNNATLTGAGALFDGLTNFEAQSGTTLDVSNNAIENTNLGDFNFSAGSNLVVDMQLNLSTGDIISDKILGSSTSSTNSVVVSIGNLIGIGDYENVTGKSGFIEIFESGNVSVNPFSQSSTYSILTRQYTLTLDSATNGLDYGVVVGNNSLANAVTSVINPREYKMDIAETAGVGNLVGNMVISANNNEITDGTISMQANSSLVVNDATMKANVNIGENAKLTLNDTNYNNANIEFVNDNATLTLNNTSLATNITSTSANSVVNFKSGVINFSGTMSGVDANLDVDLNRTAQDTNVDYTLNSGTLSYANDNYLSGGTNSITANGGSLNLVNGVASNIGLSSLNLSKDLELGLDVDLANKEIDKFDSAAFVANGNVLNITHLNIISHGEDLVTKVQFSDDDSVGGIIDSTEYNGSPKIETTALSPIYIYDVLYDEGWFTFSRQGGDEGFTPGVQTESVSNQTIYNTNLDFSKQMLAALDAYSPIYGRSTGDEQKIGGAWVKAYASDEDVNLGHLKVESKTYAGILGVDSMPQYYGNAMKGIYSLYLAYLQSEQDYSGINMQQDGINFGARAMFDKGNWFGGAVTNLGFNLIDATSLAGDEDFETYTASVALRTGYDINLYCQEYVLQPNITLSYLYAYTPNYNNASNVKIESDALHALNINPEVKFIAHLDNGYSPYVTVGYNWNVEGGGDIKANNISLPELSVDPYAEYKVGFTKKASQGISGYFEAFATTGGRQGYGGQVGLKWDF